LFKPANLVIYEQIFAELIKFKEIEPSKNGLFFETNILVE